MNKHLHFLSLLWLSMLMAFMTACSDDKNITDPAPEPEPPVEGHGPHLPPLPTHGTRPNGQTSPTNYWSIPSPTATETDMET